MSEDYIKQLEAENEKLRSDMEKRDATLYELVRKKLRVMKDKGGNFRLSLKGDKVSLTDEEVLMLTGIDADIVTPMEFPTLNINDIVSVQPMMSNTTYKDFMTAFGLPYNMTTNSTSSSSYSNFSNIAMPIIRNALSQEEVEREIEKITEHQKQMDELRKQVEEENK